MDSISKCVDKLEGAYSFVMISVLDPEALYIVKNTGTMVIGVSNHLHASEDKNIQTLDTSDNSDETTTDDHQFQIVASDTTVF